MASSIARAWFQRLTAGFMLLAFSCYSLVSFAADDEPELNVKPKVQVLKGYRLKYSVETSASQSTIWRLWSDVKHWNKFDTLLEYSYLDNGNEFEQGATGVIKAEGANKTRFKLQDVVDGVSFTETLYVPLYQSIDLKRYFEESDTGTTVFTHEVVFRGRLRFLIYAVAASTFKSELPLVMGRLKDVAEQEELSDIE